MKDFVKKLVYARMVYRNPTARWGSPPLPVFELGKARLPSTMDLSAVDFYAIRYQSSMVLLDNKPTKLSVSEFIADFDFSHGYCQVSLHADSQECQPLLSQDGMLTSTRVLHAKTTAVAYLQSTVSAEISGKLHENLFQCLDEIFLHCPTVPLLFDATETFSSHVSASMSVPIQRGSYFLLNPCRGVDLSLTSINGTSIERMWNPYVKCLPLLPMQTSSCLFVPLTGSARAISTTLP